MVRVKSRVVHSRGKFNNLARLAVGLTIGTIAVVNLQPYIGFAGSLINEIDTVPLIQPIVQLPFIGGVITWIAPWFYELIAIALWVLVQTAQCGKGLLQLLDIRDPWWIANISRWSQPELKALAYCAEITVSFMRYPPYIGGWERLMTDLPYPDMQMIDWASMSKAVLVIFAFELGVNLLNRQPEYGPQRAKGW